MEVEVNREIIKRAVELLREHADELRISHTLHPYTDLATMEPEVRAYYDEEMQIADDLDALAAQMGEPVDEVMELALCESQSLVLRVGQLYRFRPVGDCEKCSAMAYEAERAYGKHQESSHEADT
jgi:hypothetical protein